jgi:hypothetical protein
MKETLEKFIKENTEPIDMDSTTMNAILAIQKYKED